MTTLYHDTFPLLLRLIRPFTSWTITPSPSPPVPFGPSFILTPMSLPLLPQLLWCHVTVHVPAIADPDIAEITRLASPLLSSSIPSSLLTTPRRDLHVTGLRRQVFPLTCALWYHPLTAFMDHVHSHIHHLDSSSRYVYYI